MQIRIVKPNLDAALTLAERMREEDRIELNASSGCETVDDYASSIRTALKDSVMSWQVESENGELLMLGGAGVLSVIGGGGIPWMLATKDACRYPVALFKTCKQCVEEMRTRFSYLRNFAHADNEPSLRLLVHLGFRLDGLLSYRNNLFIEFSMEGKDQCVTLH